MQESARKTKVIVTVGPATGSPVEIARLIDAGADVFRFNLSHARHPWVREVADHVRTIAGSRARHVGLLMDTQGPAIRTGDVPAPLDLKPGDKFVFTVRGEKHSEIASVEVNYEHFVDDISVGDIVLVDNGILEMRVLKKFGNKVECSVLTPGQLGNRRHINLPGVKVNLPAITAKDRADVALGLELGFDFIAMSFVREAANLDEMRELVRGAERPPLLVAKVEDQQAVAHFGEIARAADAIMVARGDLGIEVPFEELPIIQRRLVKTCQEIGRPVIVATHMLESMIQNPMPTRAEITDVANAVYEQADAVMLSGETSIGRYPSRCVQVLDRVCRRVERSGGANFQAKAELDNPRQKLVKSAVVMADELRAEALIVFTRSGTMARYCAWMRPQHSPIIALCPNAITARSLTFAYGVRPIVVAPFDTQDPERTIDTGLNALLETGALRSGQTVVVVSTMTSGTTDVDAVQMRVL